MREQRLSAALSLFRPIATSLLLLTLAHPSQSFSSNSNSKDELHP